MGIACLLLFMSQNSHAQRYEVETNSIRPSKILKGNAAYFSFNVENVSGSAKTDYIFLGIYNSSKVLITPLDEINSLGKDKDVDLILDTDSIKSAPGTYYLRVSYGASKGSTYTTLIEEEIEIHARTITHLHVSEIDVEQYITDGEYFDIDIAVTNDSTVDNTAKFFLQVFETNGTHVTDFDTQDEIDAGDEEHLKFNTTSLSVDDGTYDLLVRYKYPGTSTYVTIYTDELVVHKPLSFSFVSVPERDFYLKDNACDFDVELTGGNGKDIEVKAIFDHRGSSRIYQFDMEEQSGDYVYTERLENMYTGPYNINFEAKQTGHTYTSVTAQNASIYNLKDKVEVTQFTTTPIVPLQDKQLVINATIKNTGEANSEATYFLTVDTDATILDQHTGINAGQQTVLSADISSLSWPLGKNVILIQYQYPGSTRKYTLEEKVVYVQAIPAPELEISAETIPDHFLREADNGEFSVTITNTGNASYEGKLFISMTDNDGNIDNQVIRNVTIDEQDDYILSLTPGNISTGASRYTVRVYSLEDGSSDYVTLHEENIPVYDQLVLGVSSYIVAGDIIPVQVTFPESDELDVDDLSMTLTYEQEEQSHDVSMTYKGTENRIVRYEAMVTLIGGGVNLSIEREYDAIKQIKPIERINVFNKDELNKACDDAGKFYHVPSTVLKALIIQEQDEDTRDGEIGFANLNTKGISTPLLPPLQNITKHGVEALAYMLKEGTNSFDGWDEYETMNHGEILDLFEYPTNRSEQSLRANVQALALTLRYFAHVMYPNGEMLATKNYDLSADWDQSFPQQALESWWFVISQYGIPNDFILSFNNAGDIKTLMGNNYPHRVYDNIMRGKVNDSIPITLPPHFNVEVATNDQINDGLARRDDWSLIYTMPHPDSIDGKVILRHTIPFNPQLDLGIMHDSDGNVHESNTEPFELHFPFPGLSATTAQINAYYDYSHPGIWTGSSYETDGLMINFNGYSPTVAYDGHPGTDYQSRGGHISEETGEWVADPQTLWWLQYPTNTGKVQYSSNENNFTHSIIHDGLGSRYISRYIHGECTNYTSGSIITQDDMDTYFVKTGDKNAAGVPHLHYELLRCISINPQDWNQYDPSWWDTVDPYRWNVNDEILGTFPQQNGMWRQEARNNDLPKIASELLNPNESCDEGDHGQLATALDTDFDIVIEESESIGGTVTVQNNEKPFSGLIRMSALLTLEGGRLEEEPDTLVVEVHPVSLDPFDTLSLSFNTSRLFEPGTYLFRAEFFADGDTVWRMIAYKRMTLEIPTGFDSDNIDDAIRVYPNPASENVTINLPSINKGSQLTIMNSLGQRLSVHRLQQQSNTIDISRLNSGVYILLIQYGDYRKRIVFTIE